ncbi:P-loop NTPase [Halorubrum rutilum]|uniref:Iron-sulfur cluster carrier protein n=1 Tax=Halorubrum rutilum TaxID=1364933 RepID=A0ABD6AHB2_9EURY|nr:P-loop NTPase [Halorubrum rutilum]
MAADRPLVDRVADALADADLPGIEADDPFTAGVVTDLRSDDGAVTAAVSLPDVDAETADRVGERIRVAAFEVPGVESVSVEPAPPDGTDPHGSRGRGVHGHEAPEHGESGRGHGGHGPDEDRVLDGVDRVVAVASANGGVGKTTVTVALVRGLAAAGLDVGLFDADVYGPNVPELLDVDGPVEATDDGRAAPVECGGIEAMSVGLLAEGGPVAWRGSMAHEALTELLFDTAWGRTTDGDLDVLVVDMPPGTGDVPLTVSQSVPVDGAVLVSTPSPTALADTDRCASLFDENGVPTLGVVSNMDGFTCPSCGDTHDLFDGEGPAERLDAPLLASLPFDASLRDALRVDDGEDSRDGDDPETGSTDTEPAAPEPARELAGAVRSRLPDEDPDPLPESAVDLRGMPERARREHLRAEAGAIDPGEPLRVIHDTNPEPLLDAIAAGFDRPLARLDATVHRHRTEAWSLTVERPAAESDSGDESAADGDYSEMSSGAGSESKRI